ncbi:MAG: DUF2845 domain-containing protein [Geothermobacteraceae bacterium]
MKRLTVQLAKTFGIAALALLISPAGASALRCGSDLVDVGDLKHEVLTACGEPLSREVLGYIDRDRDGERIRVLKIEEWIIELDNRFVSLEFEGNILIRIRPAGTK